MAAAAAATALAERGEGRLLKNPLLCDGCTIIVDGVALCIAGAAAATTTEGPVPGGYGAATAAI